MGRYMRSGVILAIVGSIALLAGWVHQGHGAWTAAYVMFGISLAQKGEPDA